MPCDNPTAGCEPCKLKTVTDCGDQDCEWSGDEHFALVKCMVLEKEMPEEWKKVGQ